MGVIVKKLIFLTFLLLFGFINHSYPMKRIENTNENKTTELHTLILDGEIEKIKELLDKKPEKQAELLSAVDPGKNTPLHIAMSLTPTYFSMLSYKEAKSHAKPQKKHETLSDEIIETLINYILKQPNAILKQPNAKKILNAKNEYGNTPLHSAVTNNKSKIIKQILELKDSNNLTLIERDALDKNKDTPLHCAASFGFHEIVEILSTDKNIYFKNNEGNTPLHLSIATSSNENISNSLYPFLGTSSSIDYKKCITLFLVKSKKKLLFSANNDGKIPIQLTPRYPNSEPINEGCFNLIKSTQNSIFNPLVESLSNDSDDDFIKKVNEQLKKYDIESIENLINPDTETTLLHLAASLNKNSLFKVKAIEAQQKQTQTTKSQSEKNHKKSKRNAKKKKPRRNKKRQLEKQQLEKQNNAAKIIQNNFRIYLAKKELQNKQQILENKKQELQIIKNNILKSISQLGKEKTLSVKEVRKLRDLKTQVAQSMKYLTELKGQNNNTILHLFSTYGLLDESFIKKFILNNGKINEQNNTGETILHMSILNGYSRQTELLINSKSDITIRNKEKDTPLHWAILAHNNSEVLDQDTNEPRNNCEIIKKLINKKTINAQDNDGNTPLHLAAYLGHLDLVSILIKAKCDINIKNHNGKTPLHYAAINNHKDIVQKLVDNNADLDARDNRNKNPYYYVNDQADYKEIATMLKTAWNKQKNKQRQNRKPKKIEQNWRKPY